MVLRGKEIQHSLQAIGLIHFQIGSYTVVSTKKEKDKDQVEEEDKEKTKEESQEGDVILYENTWRTVS